MSSVNFVIKSMIWAVIALLVILLPSFSACLKIYKKLVLGVAYKIITLADPNETTYYIKVLVGFTN